MTTTGTAPATGTPAAAGATGATTIDIDNTQKLPVGPSPAPAALTSAVDVALKSAPAAGTVLTFGCTVTDNLGQTSALATATVTIVGKPSVQITPPAQNVAPGAPIGLTANATSPGGNIASYSWTLQSVKGAG